MKQCTNNKLTDIWRDLNENVQQFTWRRTDKSQASRIDMIFIGMDCHMLVESCKIKPAFIQSTDHLSVFLKLRSGVQEKGRGFWKINNYILQELEYQTLINHLIDKQDIIDYADIYKIEGSLVFIDFKKNFRFIKMGFMLLTLKRFGFNDSFVNWVNTMYSDLCH
jgi:hypothetical protein